MTVIDVFRGVHRLFFLSGQVKKIYIHYKFLWGLLFFGGGGLFLFLHQQEQGFTVGSLFLLLLSALFTILHVWILWAHRHDKEVAPKSKPIVATFTETEIRFPNGYYFRQSSVAKTKKVPIACITEVTKGTYPPSFVLDDKEVIFVDHQYGDALIALAEKHTIRITERIDIWELLNEPFLDTEIEKEQQQRTLSVLAENGVSLEEVLQIRKDIQATMFANHFAWEWIYLGLFDYLSWKFLLSKEHYWWSMEIALRNYQPTLKV